MQANRVRRFRPAWDDAQRANVAVFMLHTADAFVVTLFAAYLKTRGYAVAEIGVLVGLIAVASLLSRIPAGRAADGRHARTWFIISSGVLAISVAAYPFATAVWAIVLARLAHGFASGAATTLNFAAFLGVASGPRRAQATALYTAAMSGGYTLGNFVAGAAADRFGYTAAFLVAALCPALAVFAGARSHHAAARLIAAPAAGSGAGGLRALLARPDVRAVPLLAFSLNFTHQTVGTLFPLYMLAVGQSLSVIGISRGFQSLANTVIRPFGAPLLGLFGLVGLACFGLVLHALTVASIPLFTAPLALVAVFILMGVGRGSAIVANLLTTSELSARETIKRGTASSLTSIGQDSAAIIAPVVAGLTAAQIGVGPAMQVLPIIAASAGILVMLQARAALRAAAATPT